MSALCDVLTALNMTLGLFCQPQAPGKALPLPKDDKAVWSYKSPAPPKAIKTPAFPPVIIHEETSSPPPPPPPPPVVQVSAPPPPPPEDPYRTALAAELATRDVLPASFSVEGIVDGGGNEEQLASLTAPRLTGPLDLPPPNSQKRYNLPGPKSSLPVDNSRIITADRYIPGILETGLNSQLGSTTGGQAIIQTSRDVFGYHGRNILIPKGSRLICDYESPGRQGETRIGFVCSRILLAGHRAEILQLTAPVGDVQGHGGVSGEVDNRFWDKYGTAFILAGISASIRYASVLATPTNPDGTQSAAGAIADKGSQELSQKLGEITASILEQTVNLAPIITIAQGTRVQVRPAQDWYIREIGEKQ